MNNETRVSVVSHVAALVRAARLHAVAVVIAVLGIVASTAQAVDLREVHWGFDGKLTPGRFNNIYVLMVSNEAEGFDGTVELATSEFGATPVVQRVFVSPFASKWVVFTTLVSEHNSRWIIRWGKSGQERAEFDPPQFGRRATVLLTQADSIRRVTGDIKPLPDVLFPTSVAQMDGLAAAVLDYAPRWEPARRQALLDWLQAGGTLHVLRDEKGEYPVFTDELAPLNSPLEVTHVGAGSVVRHAIGRGDLTSAVLRNAGYDVPTGDPNNYARLTLASTMAQNLRAMTSVEHNWGLIYLLCLAYVAVVGPVNYVVSRRVRDYRVSVLVAVAAIPLFSLAFYFVGQRGYGERASTHTIAYARPLGGARFDTTQWSNVFVTTGGVYRLTHPGANNFYAPAGDEEAKGIIENGKDGTYAADLPLYSSHALVHRAVMEGEEVKASVAKWPGASAEELIQGMAFSISLPADQVKQAMCLYNGMFYPLKSEQGRLVPAGAGVQYNQDSGRFMYTDSYQPGGYHPGYRQVNVTSVEGRLATTFAPLLYWVLQMDESAADVMKPFMGTDEIQLFVLAPQPKGFAIKGAGSLREEGLVLYHYVFHREAPVAVE